MPLTARLRLERAVLTVVAIVVSCFGCTRGTPPPEVASTVPSPVAASFETEVETPERHAASEESQVASSLDASSNVDVEEDLSHLYELQFDIAASANISLPACTFRDLGMPQETTIQGCLSAHCINDRGGLSICRCQEEDLETDGNWIRVTLGNTVIAEWDTWNDMLGSSSLTAALVDLDSDSVDELVVSGRENVLCGEGAEAFNVAIVELDSPGRRPLRFHSWEFDADAFVRNQADGRCAILATDIFLAGWMDYRFIARPYFYQGEGYLVPAASLPILEMAHQFAMGDRYTEEGDRRPGSQGPRSWFDRPGTRVLSVDPMLLGQVRGQLQVTIGHAEDLDDRGGSVVAFLLRFDGPGQLQMNYSYADVVSMESDLPTVLVMGHAPTGRLYPRGYSPSVGPSYFRGRQGRLEARQSASGNEQILWLASSSIP